MRFLQSVKDGGPESPVTRYWLIEIKSLFSIVLLHFGKGGQEAFHSHAFNAVTLWLKGRVYEHVFNRATKATETRGWQAGQLKYTSREHMHKVSTPEGAWAVSFRGPWRNTWQEYSPRMQTLTTLTNGRKVVAEI